MSEKQEMNTDQFICQMVPKKTVTDFLHEIGKGIPYRLEHYEGSILAMVIPPDETRQNLLKNFESHVLPSGVTPESKRIERVTATVGTKNVPLIHYYEANNELIEALVAYGLIRGDREVPLKEELQIDSYKGLTGKGSERQQ